MFLGCFVKFPALKNSQCMWCGLWSSGLVLGLIHLLHNPNMPYPRSEVQCQTALGGKGARVLNCSLLCIACTNRLTNLNACTDTLHTHTHTPLFTLSHSLPLSVTPCPSFPALEITSKRAGSLEERRSGIQLQQSSWEGPTGGADSPPPVTLSP